MGLVRTKVCWKEARRAVATRHPPVDLFELVADDTDWELLCKLEMQTNPRLRENAGLISAIPVEERRTGPRASPVMAAFSHFRPGRFNDNTFGAYYAASTLEGALSEWGYHIGRVFRDAHAQPGEVSDARIYVGLVEGFFTNVRNHPEFHESDNYTEGQALGRQLMARKQDGVLYRSVRHPPSDCVAVLRARLVANPIESAKFSLMFDGQRMVSAVAYSGSLKFKL